MVQIFSSSSLSFLPPFIYSSWTHLSLPHTTPRLICALCLSNDRQWQWRKNWSILEQFGRRSRQTQRSRWRHGDRDTVGVCIGQGDFRSGIKCVSSLTYWMVMRGCWSNDWCLGWFTQYVTWIIVLIKGCESRLSMHDNRRKTLYCSRQLWTCFSTYMK